MQRGEYDVARWQVAARGEVVKGTTRRPGVARDGDRRYVVVRRGMKQQEAVRCGERRRIAASSGMMG